MDEIRKFFDVRREYERIKMPRGVISGNPNAFLVKEEESFLSRQQIKRENKMMRDTSYVESVVKHEETLMMNMSRATLNISRYSSFDDLSDDDDDKDKIDLVMTEEDILKRDKKLGIKDDVYTKYDFDIEPDTSLPVFDAREKILNLIDQSPVVILQGDTGCGKTTQIPQYILDNARTRNEYCKIVVTQPRRLAAISISRRVSRERGWNNGTVVGYKIGLHQEVNDDTRIEYCTTGVLLQKLIGEKTLDRYTHIILDEVHERDQEMDFLLIVVRRLLATKSRHVKIILMSATINAEKFANYFKIDKNPAPVLNVSHRRMYSVNEFYLEDCCRINKDNEATVDFEKPGISNEMYKLVIRLIVIIETIEEESKKNFTGEHYIDASVLIFLPGYHEIEELYRELTQASAFKWMNNTMFPIRLHSLISMEEQQKIFEKPPPGHRKIILATNIAESSITVPDVKYVIDFCLTKSLYADTCNGFSTLRLKWASKANCRQRAGRAGRVMDGRVYRLMYRDTFERKFEEFETPEMLRSPLESVVLKAKLLDMGTPPEIIGLAMDPPYIEDIHNTILNLKELGALYIHAKGRYTIEDGDLSFIGRTMARLPLDPRLTRLILFGHIFSLLPEAIIMAAGLSVRTIFESNRPGKNRSVDAFYQKMIWSVGSGSDLIAILQAYETWRTYSEGLRISHSNQDQRSWTRRYYLNLRSLKEMHLLVQDITERLKHLGIEETSDAYQRINYLDHEKFIILKVIIAGAFYPNFFTRSSKDDTNYVNNLGQILCDHDPLNTVYLRGLHASHVGQLYTKSIKEIFSAIKVPPENIHVDFLKGSERIFVTFEPSDSSKKYKVAPGIVLDEVHKAIRMRIEGIPMTIHVMEPTYGYEYAENHGAGKLVEGEWVPKMRNAENAEMVIVPSLFEKTFHGQIVHIDTCGQFYMRPVNEFLGLTENEDCLNEDLKSSDYSFKSPSEVEVGMTVAAPFESESYFRAKIMQILPTGNRMRFRVKYIDYGNCADIHLSELRRIPDHLVDMAKIPPRCVECRLANIQPSAVLTGKSEWHTETTELLQKIGDSGSLDVEVYSVANFIVSVIINTEDGVFNEMLVDKNYAQFCEESFLSMQDHDLRFRMQKDASFYGEHKLKEQNKEYVRSMIIKDYVQIDPPPLELCTETVKLRGPFTPLETTIYSAHRFGASHSVSIERDSINSVLLDHNPQSKNEQLLIAANITGTRNSNSVTARSTTWGPNIHGFGALMALLFARVVQLKPNERGTKFVSLLAGLGVDKETGKPLYEEHDIIMHLDADIVTSDLETINRLRHLMDKILFIDIYEESPAIDKKACDDTKALIKNLIIPLLNKQRNYVEAQNDYKDLVWENYNPKDLVGNDSIYGDRSLFPLHKKLKLKHEKLEIINGLRQHCAYLYDVSKFNDNFEPILCRLCNQMLQDVLQLRMHLICQLHKNREKQIHFVVKASEKSNASQSKAEVPGTSGATKH